MTSKILTVMMTVKKNDFQQKKTFSTKKTVLLKIMPF